MHPDVQNYIDRINGNDLLLTVINLHYRNVTDDDLSLLMAALANNPKVAQIITQLDLSSNKLTVAPDLTGLAALECLYLGFNKLSVAPDLTGLRALKDLGLAPNQLRVAPDLTGLTNLANLELDNNKLKLSPVLTGLVALETLSLNNNLLTVASKIKLKVEQETGAVNFTLFEFQPPNDTTLTHEILKEHFQAILENLQSANNMLQPMRSMLVRGTGLPNELIRMVFDFLGENQVSPIKSRNYMELELNTFRNLLPEQHEIINHFESSDEFKSMKNACDKSLLKLESEARVDASRMKTLLNSYRLKRDTPEFQNLRDRVDPASNPFQVTVWRPRPQ